jgi:hypothetical protein
VDFLFYRETREAAMSFMPRTPYEIHRTRLPLQNARGNDALRILTRGRQMRWPNFLKF